MRRFCCTLPGNHTVAVTSLDPRALNVGLTLAKIDVMLRATHGTQRNVAFQGLPTPGAVVRFLMWLRR